MDSHIFARSRMLYLCLPIIVTILLTGIAVPALADFTLTVYEQTGSISTYTFNQNDPRVFTDLAGLPGPVTLGYSGYDFGTGGCEYYDIFFCDSAGTALDIGPGDPLPLDIFFKLECWDISCTDGQAVGSPGWPGAGNNIDAVVLDMDGQLFYGQAVVEEVYGLCQEPFELKDSNFADEALGPPDAGITKMGGGWTVITLYMGSVPSSDCEVVVNYPHSETTYYIGGQHTIDIIPNTCSSSVSLELYKSDSLLCHITDISGRWYEWYGVSDCGGGPGTDYRIKATCLANPDCYDFSDYFTMADVVDDCEVVVNYPHSETTYYIGGQHTIDVIPNTCSSSVSLELYKADTLLCHITDITGRWYEWYGVSDCGGGPGTDYRIKATCLANPDCYDFSDYFTMADVVDDCEVVVNYPHSETTYYIGGQHTIDITPNTCSSSVSLELYKADSLLCHITDITGRWYEWYGVSDCGGGPGTDYRIKATCLANPDCYDFSDYFTMAEQEPSPEPVPLILFVEDIGNDEGRQVRMKWQASSLDILGSAEPVTGYALWRRIDPLPEWVTALSVPEPGPAPMYPPGDWDYLGTVPACCEETYATILPTLADSADTYGMHWSVFFVRALTETPGIYFDSPPDSGWSVDNLAPAPTAGFTGVQSIDPPGLLLSWEPGTEPDIVCYDVHKGASEDFTPDGSNLVGITSGTGMLDTGWTPADQNFYRIIAVDDSGNRGLSALLRPENISVGTYLQSFYASWRETCIEISWSLSEVGEETEFFVLRAEARGMIFEEIAGARLERDGMEFVLKDLSYEPGMTYVYRVELEEEGSRWVLFETEEINAPALPLTLMQNMPNPFNPSTTIGFYLPEKSHVRVDVYDVTGRHMSTLIDEVRSGGSHMVEWNGVDKAGNTTASGVYFYRLVAGKNVLTKKMILLR